MKTISEISREYGIPVSTINSAIDAGLLDMEIIGGKRGVDDSSEKFHSWHDARLQQSRVKGETAWVEALAEYAAEHRIRLWRQRAPGRYQVLAPLELLFSILESCPLELDFAQAASVGEVQRVTDCKWNTAEEYVGIFYASIGGNQADQYQVNHLLSKQTQLKSAYINFYRASVK